jgi:hypothetical protein
MQFDKADYGEGAAPPSCAVCASELRERYFEANGKRVCERCRAALTAPAPGTPAGRFFSAFGYGISGGIAGFFLYYGVLKLTGYELGLISIVVGLLVGFGVKKGSRGVGGAGYQALAMVLTYFAITSTYLVMFLEEAHKRNEFLGVVAWFLAIPILFAGPFLGGFQNLLGIAIVGFALYEAWKINKRPKIEIKGPFEIKPPNVA